MHHPTHHALHSTHHQHTPHPTPHPQRGRSHMGVMIAEVIEPPDVWWPEDVAEILAKAISAQRRGDAASCLELYADAMRRWQGLAQRVGQALRLFAVEGEGEGEEGEEVSGGRGGEGGLVGIVEWSDERGLQRGGGGGGGGYGSDKVNGEGRLIDASRHRHCPLPPAHSIPTQSGSGAARMSNQCVTTTPLLIFSSTHPIIPPGPPRQGRVA